MNKTATVIIPTTGQKSLDKAIKTVLNQTVKTECYVVADGENAWGKTHVIVGNNAGDKNLHACYLPINVGANGFYGHRVYAAFTHLVNTDFVLYLDEDNWLDPDHVETCIETITKNNLQWCYSLRKIWETDGEKTFFVAEDNCESLGKWPTYHGLKHIDTNCYCIRTDTAKHVASIWHGGWGQDRIFFEALNQYFKQYDCTREYTLNYLVGNNPGSVNKEFFINGNETMKLKHNGVFPWKKEI